MVSKKIGSYKQEFRSTGQISDLDFLFDPEHSSPLTHPELPFDYCGLCNREGRNLPEIGGLAGTEVAVVGAGCAGLAAAQLLMRAGLRPVIYELSQRIGGRTYSYKFKEDEHSIAELGAMRIPKSQKLIFHLCDKWGIEYQPFPNPLSVDTVVDVYGKQVFYNAEKEEWEGDQGVIGEINEVNQLYNALVAPIISTWNSTAGNLEAREALWRNYVQLYNNKSFYQALIEAGWTATQINLFGFIGIGSGGFDSFFGASFLEIVRIEIQGLEVDHQLIIGGVQQFADNLWSREFECRHWGPMSLEKLHGGKLEPGVAALRISRHEDETTQVVLTPVGSGAASYPAVVLTASPRAIDMTIDIPNDTFSQRVWTALRQLELVASEKVFVRTKTAFWTDPESPFKLYTTLTDQQPRQMYLFDIDDFVSNSGVPPYEAPGVICLSYSWAASSIKFDSLTDAQRVEVCLGAIARMESCYGPTMSAEIRRQTLDEVSICWEDEYGYNGGWRMANPGQAQYVHDLHAQTLGQPAQWDNGLYLAGEAMSWYGLSGWIDGALKTGMQAGMSALRRVASSAPST